MRWRCWLTHLNANASPLCLQVHLLYVAYGPGLKKQDEDKERAKEEEGFIDGG